MFYISFQTRRMIIKCLDKKKHEKHEKEKSGKWSDHMKINQ